jgi:thioredoxin 1
MATVELTAGNFEEVISRDGITVVDFWAEWCGPCRMFGPIFESTSDKYLDITFGKVDTEAERGLAAAANITSIPTLMAFRDGILVYAKPGALSESGLTSLIEGVQGLDMDAIRSEIAAENQSE